MGSGKPGLAVFAGRPCKARCVGTLEPGADMAPPLTDSAETVERKNDLPPFFDERTLDRLASKVHFC
jgi:hypothetical protein